MHIYAHVHVNICVQVHVNICVQVYIRAIALAYEDQFQIATNQHAISAAIQTHGRKRDLDRREKELERREKELDKWQL